MNPALLPALTPLVEIGAKLIDKLIPDKEAAAKAKLELLRQQQAGELQELQISMSAILAEAQSSDPWTSRARPAFLWTFYLITISLVLVAPILGIAFPLEMGVFFSNVGTGFNAIPEPMWWTFTTGYLGYTAARQYGKVRGVDK